MVRPALLAALLATACGPERAIRVALSPAAAGDAMCVWAYGDGERVFARTWPREEGPRPPAGSLTFVAGERVADEVVIGARVLRGGGVVAERRARVAFGDGLSQLELPLGRCREAAPPGPPRLAGRFDPPPDHLQAGDLDGDGRDELMAWAGGALHVLDLDPDLDPGAPGATSRLTVEGPTDLRARALADFDADCALEVVGAGAGEVRLVRDAAGAASLGPSLAPGAADVRAGAPLRVASLVLAGPDGLTVVPRGDAEPTRVAGAFTTVAVADLDGDGVDDVAASGPEGTRLFRGGSGALEERPEALPPRVADAAGPLRVADLDGDGARDLVVADGTAVRVAINRGDGLLEERSGEAPATLAAEVRALRAGDLDGDCRDEALALAADGSSAVLRLVGSRLEAVGEPPDAVDAAVGDFDGDGSGEAVWLRPSGEVVPWRP